MNVFFHPDTMGEASRNLRSFPELAQRAAACGARSVLTLLVLLGPVMPVLAAAAERPLAVTRAPEWTSLFERTSGWLGADGIYSIPLNSYDAALGPRSASHTLFVFSDTRIGEADPRTLVFREKGMPSHTAALLTGVAPTPDAIVFHHGDKGDGGLGHLFTGRHNWLNDGIAIAGHVYLTCFAEKDWKPIQLDLITLPLVGGLPDFANVRVTPNFPLLYRDDDHDIMFGVAIMDRSASAGAPRPDGYVYVYGYRDNKKEGSRKDALAARVRREVFADPAQWQFWDGQDWTSDITVGKRDAAVLQREVSAEFSVTPITEGRYQGRYLMVYCRDVQTRDMMYAVGKSPTGPFGPGVLFYQAREQELYNPFNHGATYTYNAKAHPHLSPPGRLLISYNVNQGGSNPKTTEIYRPRFLWLDLNRAADPAEPHALAARKNVALNAKATASSHPELAARAVNGKAEPQEDKWQSADAVGDHWLAVDLGADIAIARYTVRHASLNGQAPTAQNTRDFALQASHDGTTWSDLDVVTGETHPTTERVLAAPVSARHFRLRITRPTQSTDPVARIREFELFGIE